MIFPVFIVGACIISSSGQPVGTPYRLGTLTGSKNGLRLSKGLTAQVIARTGERVTYTSPEARNASSSRDFHAQPDGADVFALPDGGYIYVSNSELDDGEGGVYGIEFDSIGRVRDYKTLLAGTDRNCNGGRTPWKTWISCEEVPGGQCWQVDPTGANKPQQTVMGGSSGGAFEAFAFDARNAARPSFFVTEDASNGALRRYRPKEGTELSWNMLHGSGGTMDYLEFLPNKAFRWTTSLSNGRNSAAEYFPKAEGIAVRQGKLYFVSKKKKQLYTLDLNKSTYTVVSTATDDLPGGGKLDAEPDHVVVASKSGLLILTEDGESTPGLFAYDGSKYLAYFESNYDGDEVVGIAFSPDRKFMFVCIQDAGLLYQVSRTDGGTFEGRRVLKWKNGVDHGLD
jgi:uncharacterized protein